jgi:hypothetical protein
MRRFFYPIKDAAVYEEFPTQNTGLDEILEVGKSESGTNSIRSLLQFDLATISASIADGTVPANAEFDLVLYVANATNLKYNQGVELCQLSQNWDEGTGYFYQQVIQANDGVTWNRNTSGSLWSIGSAGGSYTTSSLGAISASLSALVPDLVVSITPMIQAWLSESVENDGILIKFPNEDESSHSNTGNLKFFSKETHTIYHPVLVMKWDDSTFDTGSLSALPTTPLQVVPSVRSHYRVGDVVRVNVGAREQYPLKTFDTVFSNYANVRYLPSSSYYSVVDDQSGTVLIPFDDYSKISTDQNGSFFTFKVEHMHPLRYYRVLIRVDQAAYSEVFDSNTIFTVKQ